jgi:hypothetical protein
MRIFQTEKYMRLSWRAGTERIITRLDRQHNKKMQTQKMKYETHNVKKEPHKRK